MTALKESMKTVQRGKKRADQKKTAQGVRKMTFLVFSRGAPLA